MTVETVMQLISNYIFPVVACIALAWYFSKVNDQYRADIKELTAEHRTEMAAMTEAVNNNTMVIQKLVDSMEDKK